MEREDWVPAEAVDAMLDLYLYLGSHENNNISYKDLKTLDPLARKMKLSISRAHEALEVIPRIFTRFSNGQEPILLWSRVKETTDYSVSEFLRAIYTAYRGPNYVSEAMTPKEKTEWVNEVSETANKLADLIQCSYLDGFLAIYKNEKLKDVARLIKEKNIDVDDETAKELGGVILDSRPDIRTVLLHLGLYVKSGKIKLGESEYEFSGPIVEMKRPGDRFSHKNYFIRYMIQFFQSKTQNDQLDLVHILVDTFFEETDFNSIKNIARSNR